VQDIQGIYRERRREQKKRWFRNGQKWRTGCEGRISVVKRRRCFGTAAIRRSLRLVERFDDGGELLKAAERLQLEGIVSKRRVAPYRSGDYRDWVKVKTAH
jgi:hypothetical protein